jgi:hypothetical protein
VGSKQITLRYIDILSSIKSNYYIESFKKDSRILKGFPGKPLPTTGAQHLRFWRFYGEVVFLGACPFIPIGGDNLNGMGTGVIPANVPLDQPCLGIDGHPFGRGGREGKADGIAIGILGH